jgi:Tfp pilus assembly protein PilX
MRSLCHRNLRADDGSALVAAILAMLLLSVFALSVAVLADIEARLGLNQKAAQQAVALAEAGLEHGRNMLRDAPTALDFSAYIASASTRRLGVPNSGIPLGPGKYWVRVDNDCATPAGYAGTPTFVPTVVEDNPGAGCSDTTDANETVALTAWSEVTDGAGRVIGRARLRAHYTIGNPWKHSCYDQDGGLCIEDAVGGCNSNPCIDPSDPQHPNGPAVGDLPIPSDIRCGTGGNPPHLAIDPEDIPADVLASGAITTNAPCVIYPYYEWALRQAAPTRTWCPLITSGGYGAELCSGPGELSPPGTLAMDLGNSVCTDPLTASKCHGMVFFGPGTGFLALAEQADVSVGGTGGVQAGCMGTRSGSTVCPGSNSSVVVYVMGKLTITNNVEINGTVVLHGNHVAGGGTNRDFGLTGTNRTTTHPCTGIPAGTASPGCGYPLAILAYNPNETPPTTATGQTIWLDLSNATSLVSGLIYTGGTADFNPLTVDGGLIGWDVNITNTSSRITYNPTYGNAAPPPFFSTPTDGAGVLMFPATWVHCTYYADETGGPTPCS